MLRVTVADHEYIVTAADQPLFDEAAQLLSHTLVTRSLGFKFVRVVDQPGPGHAAGQVAQGQHSQAVRVDAGDFTAAQAG
ncbi:hypothetical protein G6F55_014458 [Rhizopus delemar]|nr:hypothetical protein G6F55_014458 [Rhizopus delemar]